MEDLGVLLVDPAERGGLTRDPVSAFAQSPGPRSGAAVRRAGSRGQHNPPFQPRRRASPSGRCGGCGARALRLSFQRGPAVTHSLGPLPSPLSPSHLHSLRSKDSLPPSVRLQPLWIQILMGSAGSVCVGARLLHPLAYPLADFWKLLQAWPWT